MSINKWCPTLISCVSLTDKMICNALWLILQGGIRDSCVCQDGLIVTWDIGRTLTWDPHHSELVAKLLYIFTVLLHCYEFWAEADWLHTSLLLGEPIYSITVEMYKKTDPRSSSHSVSGMVCIDLGSQKNLGLMVEASLGGVLIFRRLAQTHCISSPSIWRGMYQSMGC